MVGQVALTLEPGCSDSGIFAGLLAFAFCFTLWLFGFSFAFALPGVNSPSELKESLFTVELGFLV